MKKLAVLAALICAMNAQAQEKVDDLFPGGLNTFNFTLKDPVKQENKNIRLEIIETDKQQMRKISNFNGVVASDGVLTFENYTEIPYIKSVMLNEKTGISEKTYAYYKDGMRLEVKVEKNVPDMYQITIKKDTFLDKKHYHGIDLVTSHEYMNTVTVNLVKQTPAEVKLSDNVSVRATVL